MAIRNNSRFCEYSLLEGYQNFDKIIEKEGEEFLFSCWIIKIGLKGKEEIKQIYKLRKDEWVAKIEENKLKNII